jgi:DNA replication protein DnaC
MIMSNDEDLKSMLVRLGLRWLAGELDDVLAKAAKARWSAMQMLEHVARRELDERAARGVHRRLGRAKLGDFKVLADFDWSWPKKIDRERVEGLLSLDFMHHLQNVVLIGPHGLGKTTIAQNLGYAALVAGHTVRMITTSELLLDLDAAEQTRKLERRLRFWANLRLLVLDELGYVSYDNHNADLLYQVMSRRHERRSTVITTNLAFRDWVSVFPSTGSAAALIDRVVHHSAVIAIEGDSYRLREAEQSRKNSKPKR